MLDLVRSHGVMPEEIYSDKGKTDDNCSLEKVILHDIFCQARTSGALSSIDASNFHDSITHAIVSLIFQAFGFPIEEVESMLTQIEEIKYFLWTAYGDSNFFSGSTIKLKFQGLCQCSDAAPAGWEVISVAIICAHKRKGHGCHCVSYL